MRFESGQNNIYFTFQLAANSFNWRKQSMLPLVSPRNEVWGTKAKIYTDDGLLTRSRISTSDWLKQISFMVRSINQKIHPYFVFFPHCGALSQATQISAVTRHQYEISRLVPLRRLFLGSPVGVSRNIDSWVINIIFYANLVHFDGTFLGILSQH